MKIEQKRLLEDQAVRALNARDWETYGRLFAESLVAHVPGLAEPVKGRDARVKWAQAFLEAFPDCRVETRQSFGQGDRLCVELSFTGTHTGPLRRPGEKIIAATNKAVRFPFCLILQFESGEVKELHEYFDQLELLT